MIPVIEKSKMSLVLRKPRNDCSVIDKISFFRSKSIVANTNTTATAIYLERFERVWFGALAVDLSGTVIFCFIVAISFVSVAISFAFTVAVSFVFTGTSFLLNQFLL